MATGTLRAVLWFLGSLGALWLLLGIFLLPSMGRMMGGGGTGSERMMGSDMMPMMGGMMGMGTMMILMVVQLIAMLGLVGIFIYLVVDSLRRRSSTTAG
jgi:uncharacterized membrane protein